LTADDIPHISTNIDRLGPEGRQPKIITKRSNDGGQVEKLHFPNPRECVRKESKKNRSSPFEQEVTHAVFHDETRRTDFNLA
jgi:hypothetical protein